MAVCTNCDREMTSGVSCDRVMFDFGGHPVSPVAHDGDAACPDCRTPVGGYHHPGCDRERCPRCGCQAISCDCDDAKVEA